MKKRLFALLAAVCLCAGCSTTQSQITRQNAGIYVKGVLDETYTGKASDAYRTLTDRTQEDGQAAFEKNLEAEYAQRLCVRFELEEEFVPRSLKEDFLDLLDQVYLRAGYSVKSVTPMDNGRYCVEVTVTPVTFFAAAYADGYRALREDFEKAHPLPGDEEEEAGEDDVVDADDADKDPTPAQLRKARQTREALWAQEVYDYLYPRLDAVTTGSSVTRLVLVSADQNGLYTLSETDLQGLDDLILQY